MRVLRWSKTVFFCRFSKLYVPGATPFGTKTASSCADHTAHDLAVPFSPMPERRGNVADRQNQQCPAQQTMKIAAQFGHPFDLVAFEAWHQWNAPGRKRPARAILAYQRNGRYQEH